MAGSLQINKKSAATTTIYHHFGIPSDVPRVGLNEYFMC